MAEESATPMMKHDEYVFLGGSCDPTTWRQKTAIPDLEAAGVSYFNPQVSDWKPDNILAETSAKENNTILLFVIDSQTRAIASMLEATEYIMRGREVVIVIETIPQNTEIDGEVVAGRQLKDLNRARLFLCDIVARHQQNCTLFGNVKKAITHIIATRQDSDKPTAL